MGTLAPKVATNLGRKVPSSTVPSVHIVTVQHSNLFNFLSRDDCRATATPAKTEVMKPRRRTRSFPHFLSSFEIMHDDGLVLLPSVTGFSSIMEIP
jgi:hypothetical protein